MEPNSKESYISQVKNLRKVLLQFCYLLDFFITRAEFTLLTNVTNTLCMCLSLPPYVCVASELASYYSTEMKGERETVLINTDWNIGYILIY